VGARRVIEREALVEMFDSITERGDWDMTQPMLWGYFFTHREPTVLRAAIPKLQCDDYEFVDMFQSTKEDGNDRELWWLHVQRVEVHSVDSLFARNERLYEFAHRHGIESYDGMDVGPVPVVARPA
jgi:hypothetical protein